MKSCRNTRKHVLCINAVLFAKPCRADEAVVFGKLTLSILANALDSVAEELVFEAVNEVFGEGCELIHRNTVLEVQRTRGFCKSRGNERSHVLILNCLPNVGIAAKRAEIRCHRVAHIM